MKDYLICCDASADVDISIIEQNGIKFVPMEYSLGEEMREYSGSETDEILHEFYEGQRKGDLTKTSQVTPAQYSEFFKPMLKEGSDVLYMSLSSGLSSTYQSACMAAENVNKKYPGKLYPFDTLSATGGTGCLTERAVRNRAAGMSIEDNIADLKEAAKHGHYWFLVQDLMYLKRGGRVGAATAAVGTLLNMRPILNVDKEGKLVTIGKERGTKSACKNVINHFLENADPLSTDTVYVIDADDKATGDILEEAVRSNYPDVTVRRVTLSPIIGAHTGPSMAAICHIGK